MGYRILADEHVEQAAIRHLSSLGHDVQWVGDVPELGLGSDDRVIDAVAAERERLVLTQDDDFLTCQTLEQSAGILFQQDGSLSPREIGDIVEALPTYVDQSEVTVEHVSRNWLQE